MSNTERDKIAEIIASVRWPDLTWSYIVNQSDPEHFRREADALLAAGYRKVDEQDAIALLTKISFNVRAAGTYQQGGYPDLSLIAVANAIDAVIKESEK